MNRAEAANVFLYVNGYDLEMPEEELRPNDAPPHREGAARETAGKRNKQRPNEYEECDGHRALRIGRVGQRVPEVVQSIDNGDPSQNARNQP